MPARLAAGLWTAACNYLIARSSIQSQNIIEFNVKPPRPCFALPEKGGHIDSDLADYITAQVVPLEPKKAKPSGSAQLWKYRLSSYLWWACDLAVVYIPEDFGKAGFCGQFGSIEHKLLLWIKNFLIRMKNGKILLLSETREVSPSSCCGVGEDSPGSTVAKATPTIIPHLGLLTPSVRRNVKNKEYPGSRFNFLGFAFAEEFSLCEQTEH